jgi:hypothetical protein
VGQQQDFASITGLRPPRQFFRISDNMNRERLQECVQAIGRQCFPQGLKHRLIE